jgi:ABC-2 type transport system ATP-binding protein
MDEAERCTRLAILDAGRIVADGTPHDLLSKLPGRTLLIENGDPRAAQRALTGVAGVIALAQIGASLRVLAAPDADVDARIAAKLRAADVAGQVHPVPPNLEDVFVAATRKPPEAA